MKSASSIIERLKQYEPLWDGWTFSGKQFGTGGSGCVLGLQRKNEFSVVKVIYVEKSSNEYIYVKNEIETMVSLRSKYLVECLNYCVEQVYNRKGEVVGYDFLIHMNEYLPFSEYLREEDYDPDTLSVQLAREIGSALCVLHSKGILHRDVKPENIFIDNANNEQHFRLGDFGVSKKISDMSGLTATGTLNFMAPESFKYYEYSYQSDIYSFGMTLYYILNDLRFPIFGESVSQSDFDYNSECRLRGDKLPEPLYGSEKLKKVVLKCCEAKPKDRYSDVSEILNDLFDQKIQNSGIKRQKESGFKLHKKKKRFKPVILVSVLCFVIILSLATGMLILFRDNLFSKNNSSKEEINEFVSVPVSSSSEIDPKLSIYTTDFINNIQNKTITTIEKERKGEKNEYALTNSYEATLFEDGYLEVKVFPENKTGWDRYKYYVLYEFDNIGKLYYIHSEQKYESYSIYIYKGDIIRVAYGGQNQATYDYGKYENDPQIQNLVQEAPKLYTDAKKEIEKQKEGESQ